MGCIDKCRQGRETCPCPEACQIPELDENNSPVVVAMLAAALFFVLTMVLAVLI